MFMLLALWMEMYPRETVITSQAVRPTGCVIVDERDRIIALEHTGEAHAIVRAVLNCNADLKGSDVFVSRLPCPLCTKVMVQAGIRKIYYFPAKEWEVDFNAAKPRDESVKMTRNPSLNDPMAFVGVSQFVSDKLLFHSEEDELKYRSVSRLITNNPIALTFLIPNCKWLEEPSKPPEFEHKWHLDESLSRMPNISDKWNQIKDSFEKTQWVIESIASFYRQCIPKLSVQTGALLDIDTIRHAIVLAHIAAKRTNDPKCGVGSVLIGPNNKYISVGWNGYPKRVS
jgi:deoxycytidylate deaminase